MIIKSNWRIKMISGIYAKYRDAGLTAEQIDALNLPDIPSCAFVKKLLKDNIIYGFEYSTINDILKASELFNARFPDAIISYDAVVRKVVIEI